MKIKDILMIDDSKLVEGELYQIQYRKKDKELTFEGFLSKIDKYTVTFCTFVKGKGMKEISFGINSLLSDVDSINSMIKSRNTESKKNNDFATALSETESNIIETSFGNMEEYAQEEIPDITQEDIDESIEAANKPSIIDTLPDFTFPSAGSLQYKLG